MLKVMRASDIGHCKEQRILFNESPCYCHYQKSLLINSLCRISIQYCESFEDCDFSLKGQESPYVLPSFDLFFLSVLGFFHFAVTYIKLEVVESILLLSANTDLAPCQFSCSGSSVRF